MGRLAATRSCRAAALRRAAFVVFAPVLLGLSPTCCGAAQSRPDKPRMPFWFRNPDAPGFQVSTMSAEMLQIAEVCAAGRDDECRRLAQTLLGTTQDPVLRREAAGCLVQIHLGRGDFEAARAEAQRLGRVAPQASQEYLSLIDAMEAEYQARVGRLQSIVGAATDPPEAAEAQFLTARAHHGVGRRELAERSYRKVIVRYPHQPRAGEAVWQIAHLHRVHGDIDGALEACVWAAEQAPESSLVAAAAAERIALLSERSGQKPQGRASLLSLAQRFPDSALSAWAYYYLADLYLRADQADEAAEQWQVLWEYEPRASQIPDLLDRLAEARYRAAAEARQQQQCQNALTHLSFFAGMPQTEWRRNHVREAALMLDMAECHLGLEQWQQALDLASLSLKQPGHPGDAGRALYVQGCAYWSLGNYDAAAQAWMTVMNEYPATEYGNKSREKLRP